MKTSSKARTLGSLLLAFQLGNGFYVSARADDIQKNDRLLNRHFSVGYNEAWFKDANYGNWLSANPNFPLFAASQFSETRRVLDRYFEAMADGGAKVVRIWLFPALQGVRIDPARTPQTQSLTPDLLDNLETVLKRARAHRLRVYITALNGGDMFQFFGVNPTLTTYFQKLLTDSDERNAYKAKILFPILKRLEKYRGAVYAFDLVNEMEGAVAAGYVSPEQARDWISDMASFVKAHNPRLPITSSSGFGYAVPAITGGQYSGLGLDFYDAHIYADYGDNAGLTELCNYVRAEGRQIVLGEFGQSITSQVVDDDLQKQTTANFLGGAKRSCFSAALAWKFEGTIQNWFSYLLRENADGSLVFRPAYYAMKAYVEPPSRESEVSLEVTDPSARGAKNLSDPQAIHFLTMVEQSEIDAANLALSRGSSNAIKAFATELLQSHASLKQRVAASLGKLRLRPEDGNLSRSFAAAAAQHQRELSKLTGSAFDTAYLKNELFYHVAVAGTLETTLIPAAKNGDVRSVLKEGLAAFKNRQKSAQQMWMSVRPSPSIGR